jgi:hypothetical protein
MFLEITTSCSPITTILDVWFRSLIFARHSSIVGVLVFSNSWYHETNFSFFVTCLLLRCRLRECVRTSFFRRWLYMNTLVQNAHFNDPLVDDPGRIKHNLRALASFQHFGWRLFSFWVFLFFVFGSPVLEFLGMIEKIEKKIKFRFRAKIWLFFVPSRAIFSFWHAGPPTDNILYYYSLFIHIFLCREWVGGCV